MKDTRPVHMGTFEMHRKSVNQQLDVYKHDIATQQKSINALYNRIAATERRIKGLIVIGIVTIISIGFAIYLTTIL